MRTFTWILCPIACTAIGCGKKDGDTSAETAAKPNSYATQRQDRGIDKWIPFRSTAFGITADFPHWTPAEIPQTSFFDKKEYPALDRAVMIETTIWGHDQGPDKAKHQFVIHLATFRKVAKDRDRELTRTKYFENINRRYHAENARPQPCTWLGKPAELIEFEYDKPKSEKFKATIRRMSTDSMMIVAAVQDGGDLPAKAKDWFFEHIVVEGIDK